MRDEQYEEQVGDRDQPVGVVEWERKGEQEKNWGLPPVAEVEGEGSGGVVECMAVVSVLWRQSAGTLVQRIWVCTKKMTYTRDRGGEESDDVQWGRGKGGTTLKARCW
jgi:hypothetical protein